MVSAGSWESGKRVIPVGILYSVSGEYGVIGREMLNGIMLSIEQVNADPTLGFTLAPVVRDPGGDLDRYYHQCHDLLHRHGVRHVVGCYTSAARKVILPLIEGANALLWHSPRYEGFESSQNVIYLGASPNQHVLPMLAWLQQSPPAGIYHVGNNYVWSWEIDRIVREVVQARGGQWMHSQWLPLGETAVEAVVRDIATRRPPAVLVTLVGQSAYHFYRAWQLAARTDPWLASEAVLKLSLTLCEAEVELVGAAALEGYLVSSVWFQTLRSQANRRFMEQYRARFGEGSSPSVDSVGAWMAGQLLARAIRRSGSDDVEAIRQALWDDVLDGPAGQVRIEPENHHAWLTPRLARCRNGVLDVFWEQAAPLKPDPWLTWVDLARLGTEDT